MPKTLFKILEENENGILVVIIPAYGDHSKVASECSRLTYMYNLMNNHS